MVIGTYKVKMLIYESNSLKGKRQALKSIVEIINYHKEIF
ncbi:MAG: DUF503 family protein [Sedimentibacter sp.]